METIKKIKKLYDTINGMMAHIGAYGDIGSRHELTSDVMDALYEIDGGEWKKDAIELLFEKYSQL